MRNRTWIMAAKKHLMLIAAIGLAVPGQFVLATPAMATTTPQGPPIDGEPTCKFFVSIGLLSANQLGVCIATGTTGDRFFIDGRGDFNGFVAADCNYLLHVIPDYFYQFWDSYTQCLADDAGF